MKQLNFLQGDIFGAGVDTSVNTIKWILVYLAKYPKDQVLLTEIIFGNI